MVWMLSSKDAYASSPLNSVTPCGSERSMRRDRRQREFAMAQPDRYLNISEPAEADYLETLKTSVEGWGRDRAAQYKGALDATMERLLEFPEIGHAVPDLFEGEYRIRIRHHWVCYTLTVRDVTIHRILHERRHVNRDLFDPDP